LPGPGTEFEDSVRKFLYDVGFQDVPRWGENRETLTLGGTEIDAFGRLDDGLYIVVDAKVSVSPRRLRTGITNRLTIINGYKDAVVRDIKNTYGSRHRYRDTIFVYWARDKVIEEGNFDTARRYSVALRDYFDLDCYNKFLKLTRNEKITRNGFLMDIALQLNRLDIFQEKPGIRAPALRTRIGSKKIYTFLVSAEELLEFAYVFRLETNNLLSSSYQRLLQPKKMGRLRAYLSTPANFFPNNLIVATHERLQMEDEDDSQVMQSGWLILPDKPCYLEILDGQHRLYAYANLPNLQDHCLCVTAIQTESGATLDSTEKASMFVTINKEQTPVPPHILWDLYRFISPNSVKAKISNFVYELNNKKPFKDLIRLPRVRSSKARLSFTNICKSLGKKRLFEDYGLQPVFAGAFIIYFETILANRNLRVDWQRSIPHRQDWQTGIAHRQRKGFLCTNNGIAILLRLLGMTLEKKGLPQEDGLGEWRQSLRDWIVGPLNLYLETKRRRDKPDDPFIDLRVANTSDAERKKTADEIFAMSPLAKESEASP